MKHLRLICLDDRYYWQTDSYPSLMSQTFRSKQAARIALANGSMKLSDPKIENEELKKELKERDASFDLRWKADMRAIDLWRKEAGRDLVLPDHVDLVLFLLKRLYKNGA